MEAVKLVVSIATSEGCAFVRTSSEPPIRGLRKSYWYQVVTLNRISRFIIITKLLLLVLQMFTLYRREVFESC